VEADFGRSVTDISLPPLGRLRADTHGAPLHLRAALREVDVEQLQEGLRRGVDSVAAEVERNTLDAVGRFAAWVVLVGIAGAAALGLLAFRNRWLLVLRATVAGLLAVVLSVGFTALGFDAAAFQAPSYTGSLRLVPQLFGPVEGAIERVGYFREELRRVVAGAARAYAAIESNPLGRGDEVRVLHISDVHLSTLGFGFAQELARSFDVDLVIDTGDTTSFGAPNEEFILSEVERFGLPYVWVRGNHDSGAFQEALERLEGTIVLDGNTAEVDGFTIYGLGHPYFNEERGTPVGDEDVIALVERAAQQVLTDVTALPEPPDIVLVHDDRMAREIAGLVPLVLSGHFHTTRDDVRDGTVFLRVGTTGGAGPTGFTAEGDVPFSAEVLYFEPNEEGRMRLVAWDVVTQFPETGSLEIARHLASDVGLSPSPSISSPTESPSP
jgi:predicted phosphodiesterase